MNITHKELKEHLIDCVLNDEMSTDLIEGINYVFEKFIPMEEQPPTILIHIDEYNDLKHDSEFLSCLNACGVDNWHGYGEAWEMMEEEVDEDE